MTNPDSDEADVIMNQIIAQDEMYEAAREILEKLLELMVIEARVTPSEEFSVNTDEGITTSIGLNIEGDDLGILIGRRGQTMASLQHIVRIIMAHKMDIKIPVVIDVEGYKQRRCEGLRALAVRLADQVKTRKIPFSMEPMSAFERRIVHLALADRNDVFTESTGVGMNRKVVIKPVT
ncbi:MAG TPA: KH domain-containing protein [Dehalococcoidia bacterium]|nr:KH domain-containing protein [Dehalococcoidia bacterium]